MGSEERRLLLDAFDSNWIAPIGPHVDAFEREICEVIGVDHAAALSSGTAALHLALIILGIQRGDRVLCPSLTFVATANVINYCGAEPVFVDSCCKSWNIDPNLVAEELKRSNKLGILPKALIAVDLYGQCADYDALESICGDYSIPIIEDAAEALGSTYGNHNAGTLGAMGVLSFNGNKIVTTSCGGMLLSRRKDWIERARFLSTQARDAAPHYQHSVIGYNYRMSNLLAALGRGQLKGLEQRVQARRKNNIFYKEALDHPGIEFMPETSYGCSNSWLTTLIVDPEAFGASREDVRLKLEELDIETRPVWKPMHLQPVFSGCRIVGGAVSEDLFNRGLCLPSGSSLSTRDRYKVVEGFLSTVRER
jgi:pyridoxal phosphate-dependent aminotransferase EpsN